MVATAATTTAAAAAAAVGARFEVRILTSEILGEDYGVCRKLYQREETSEASSGAWISA
jgi:hypothetical protein